MQLREEPTWDLGIYPRNGGELEAWGLQPPSLALCLSLCSSVLPLFGVLNRM